jgi:hypothetical protein
VGTATGAVLESESGAGGSRAITIEGEAEEASSSVVRSPQYQASMPLPYQRPPPTIAIVDWKVRFHTTGVFAQLFQLQHPTSTSSASSLPGSGGMSAVTSLHTSWSSMAVMPNNTQYSQSQSQQSQSHQPLSPFNSSMLLGSSPSVLSNISNHNHSHHSGTTGRAHLAGVPPPLHPLARTEVEYALFALDNTNSNNGPCCHCCIS